MHLHSLISYMTVLKIRFLYSKNWNETVWPRSQFLDSCVCKRLYILRISLSILLQRNRQTSPWEHINRLQIHKHGNWKTELSKWRGGTVSFLAIHKSRSDIYIGFSLALHLQCIFEDTVRGIHRSYARWVIKKITFLRRIDFWIAFRIVHFL